MSTLFKIYCFLYCGSIIYIQSPLLFIRFLSCQFLLLFIFFAFRALLRVPFHFCIICPALASLRCYTFCFTPCSGRTTRKKRTWSAKLAQLCSTMLNSPFAPLFLRSSVKWEIWYLESIIRSQHSHPWPATSVSHETPPIRVGTTWKQEGEVPTSATSGKFSNFTVFHMGLKRPRFWEDFGALKGKEGRGKPKALPASPVRPVTLLRHASRDWLKTQLGVAFEARCRFSAPAKSLGGWSTPGPGCVCQIGMKSFHYRPWSLGGDEIRTRRSACLSWFVQSPRVSLPTSKWYDLGSWAITMRVRRHLPIHLTATNLSDDVGFWPLGHGSTMECPCRRRWDVELVVVWGEPWLGSAGGSRSRIPWWLHMS